MENKLQLPDIYNCSVSLIGLGYVGLPLAVAISEQKICKVSKRKLSREVIGFDISIKRLKELSHGLDYTNEIYEEILKKTTIQFTSNPESLISTDVFVVTVPTPIDSKNNPDLTPLENASKMIGKVLNKKNNKNNKNKTIVIYESTVFPGATEEFCIPIIEKYSGLKCNYDFGCGFSPERINPGDKKHTLDSIVKVTSGSDEETSEWINKFYSSFISAGTFKAKSIKVAEAAKIIENTQRDLNIALMNELAILFKKFNIDTLDVLEAAETKWNFLSFKPGLVGGHCIGVDPYYLTHKAIKEGYSPEIILAGRKINDSMANWVVEELINAMKKKELSIKDSEVLILGLAFKENCNDIRNTKVEEIIKCLKKYNLKPYVVDPHVDIEYANKKFGNIVFSELPQNKKFSSVLVAVKHNKFINLQKKDWNKLIYEDGIIFDLKGIVPRELSTLRL